MQVTHIYNFWQDRHLVVKGSLSQRRRLDVVGQLGGRRQLGLVFHLVDVEGNARKLLSPDAASPVTESRERILGPGTDVRILKNTFAEKIGKKVAFLTQNIAKLCKVLIITLVFEKNDNFFAENGQKSQKIVIITSTPGTDVWIWEIISAKKMANTGRFRLRKRLFKDK
jgi:hypothetical protein